MMAMVLSTNKIRKARKRRKEGREYSGYLEVSPNWSSSMTYLPPIICSVAEHKRSRGAEALLWLRAHLIRRLER
jgi:hypothetical protein